MIKQLLCLIFGHPWGPWKRTVNAKVDERTCKRCRMVEKVKVCG